MDLVEKAQQLNCLEVAKEDLKKLDDENQRLRTRAAFWNREADKLEAKIDAIIEDKKVAKADLASATLKFGEVEKSELVVRLVVAEEAERAKQRAEAAAQTQTVAQRAEDVAKVVNEGLVKAVTTITNVVNHAHAHSVAQPSAEDEDVKKLLRKLDRAEATIETLERQLDRGRATTSEFPTAINNMRKECIEEYTARLNQFKNDHAAALSAASESHVAAVKKLENDYAIERSALSTASTSYAAAVEKLERDQSTSLSALENERAVLLAALEDERSALSVAAAAIEKLEGHYSTSLSALESKNSALSIALEDTRSALSAAENKNSTLSTALKDKCSALSAVENKSSALSATLRDTRSALSALENKCSVLSAAIENEQSALSAVEKKNSALSTALSAAENKNSTLSTALEDKCSALSAVENNSSALSATLKDTRSALSALENKCSVLSAAIENEQSALSAIEKKNSALSITLEDTRSALSAAENNSSALSTALSAAENKNSTLSATLKDKCSALSALEKKNSALSTALSAKSATLLDIHQQHKQELDDVQTKHGGDMAEAERRHSDNFKAVEKKLEAEFLVLCQDLTKDRDDISSALDHAIFHQEKSKTEAQEAGDRDRRCISDLEKTVDTLRSKLDETEASRSKHDVENAKLRAELKKMQAAGTAKAERLQEETTKYRKLASELQAEAAKVGRLQEAGAEHEKIARDLEAAITEERQNSSARISALEVEVSSLRLESTTKSTKLAEAITEREKIARDLAEERQSTKLAEAITEREKIAHDLAEERQSTTTRIDKLKADVTSLRLELAITTTKSAKFTKAITERDEIESGKIEALEKGALAERNRIDDLEQSLAQSEEERGDLDARITGISKQRDDLLNRVKQLEDEVSSHESIALELVRANCKLMDNLPRAPKSSTQSSLSFEGAEQSSPNFQQVLHRRRQALSDRSSRLDAPSERSSGVLEASNDRGRSFDDSTMELQRRDKLVKPYNSPQERARMQAFSFSRAALARSRLSSQKTKAKLAKRPLNPTAAPWNPAYRADFSAMMPPPPWALGMIPPPWAMPLPAQAFLPPWAMFAPTQAPVAQTSGEAQKSGEAPEVQTSGFDVNNPSQVPAASREFVSLDNPEPQDRAQDRAQDRVLQDMPQDRVQDRVPQELPQESVLSQVRGAHLPPQDRGAPKIPTRHSSRTAQTSERLEGGFGQATPANLATPGVSIRSPGVSIRSSREMQNPVEFISTGSLRTGNVVFNVHAETIAVVDRKIREWKIHRGIDPNVPGDTWASPTSRKMVCVWLKVHIAINQDVIWPPNNYYEPGSKNPSFACPICLENRNPCILAMRNLPIRVLPLPPFARSFAATPETKGYYIRE
ncbi:hypothetical protein V493_00073 [Pseudogymnoascus sp. VKM F-4281 (FW-2241)]|nr:hypothetical protein V493_00073 [Pseudogymnoascus sp. VKM F-4281 (FW-2241)]